MKHLILPILLIIGFLYSSLSFGSNSRNLNDSIEVLELDLLPMYGSIPEYGSWAKNAEQLDADRVFLESIDKGQTSRKDACLDYIELSWGFLDEGDHKNAMRRANQAWQLDSTNPEVYTLFAGILNAQYAHEEALDMLDRAIHLAPADLSLYDLFLTESIAHHKQTQDGSYLQALVEMLDMLEGEDKASQQRLDEIKTEALDILRSDN